MNGYFHQRIDQCADDALAGQDEITKLWGAFLKEFSHIAYAIASSEACDSGVEYPIMETIERSKALYEKLDAIRSYTRPFQDCMNKAVREYIENKKTK